MKILFSGGGTLGPVTPLLAIFEIYHKKNPDAKFAWVGTKSGPEKIVVEKYGIPFFYIITCKLRRYFSLRNIVDFFKFTIAFFQALILLWIEKPSLLISAGGYVSVPLHWAGAVLGIPSWVHQQDPEPGLANKLNARFAKKITTVLRETIKFFPAKKTEWMGNPVRDLVVQNKEQARAKLNLPPGPVIFALGGGTGSEQINDMVLDALPSWPKDWQIIHLIGERSANRSEHAAETFQNYHYFSFFTDEMKDAYAVADVVVARAGFGTISEMASLSKASVIIPLQGTHQEQNAQLLAKNNAAVILNEQDEIVSTIQYGGLKLAHLVSQIVLDQKMKEDLGNRLHAILPSAPPEKIIEIIEDLTE